MGMATTAAQEISYFGLKPELCIVLPVVLLVLATITVALRVYVRACMIRAWGLDDTFLVIAYVSATSLHAVYLQGS